MNKTKLDPEKIIKEYITNIISLNKDMSDYYEKQYNDCKKFTVKELLTKIEEIYKKEEEYRGKKDASLDFETYKKELKRNIVTNYFNDNKEVQDIEAQRVNIIENKNYTQEQKNTLIKGLQQRLDIFYDQHKTEIIENDYVGDFCRKTLAKKETDIYNREIVHQRFNENKSDENIILFDKDKDIGSCTKSLTLSLYELQKNYGLEIFPNLKPDNIDKLAHPTTLVEIIDKKYIKSTESGYLKDIEGGMNIGDIVILTRGNGNLGHAMMCYGFDEKTKSPLLLGFSGFNNLGVNAYSSRQGFRTGIVIDVNSLIKDAVSQADKGKTIDLPKKDFEL